MTCSYHNRMPASAPSQAMPSCKLNFQQKIGLFLQAKLQRGIKIFPFPFEHLPLINEAQYVQLYETFKSPRAFNVPQS